MVTVRAAEPHEANAVLELHQTSIRSFGPRTYDTAQVSAWAEKPEASYSISDVDHRFVMAEAAGDLAGFGDLNLTKAENAAVYVHPEYTRASVGTAILDDLEAAAREAGLDQLELLASKNAAGFYDGAGYDRIGTQLHETEGESLECVWMVKQLNQAGTDTV